MDADAQHYYDLWRGALDRARARRVVVQRTVGAARQLAAYHRNRARALQEKLTRALKLARYHRDRAAALQRQLDTALAQLEKR